MTSEKRAQFDFAPVPFRGHRAQERHRSENELCPSKSLFSFLFSMKGHRAQNKEGGQLQSKKGGKMTQKQGKRAKYKIYSQSSKQLCLVPFSISGALA